MERSEHIFYERLKDLFIGEKIEGDSGFVNLMRLKSSYFDAVFKQVREEIDLRLREYPEFKEELYDKLNTFFSSYFSESGSIYFTYTPLKAKIYDRVYTQQNDVILFWKTRMLYYVKTDKVWRNLKVEYQKGPTRYLVHFDVSRLQHKSGNEKREIMYQLGVVDPQGKTFTFYVTYSERGKRTDTEHVLKDLRKNGIPLEEEDLMSLFRIYERQNDVDYFINKDAKAFLKEQFDLWLKNYLFDESQFSNERISQLKVLRDVAYKLIDFVSQFEDELVKVWRKPKFVLNSGYVITLDRIAKKRGGVEVLKHILESKGMEEQLREWLELGLLNVTDATKLRSSLLVRNALNEETVNPKYQFLPVDTRYFKELEQEILSLFDDIDEELDGWLVHSENYQALNTLLPKFRGRVQTIYIDPPFNKEQDADYFYTVKYKDSTWATMLENRLTLAREFLSTTGCIFVRCDYNGNWIVRPIMDQIFGKDNFKNEIGVRRFKKNVMEKEVKKLPEGLDTILLYSSSEEFSFVNPYKPKEEKREGFWRHMGDSTGQGSPKSFFGRTLAPPSGKHWKFSQERIDQMIEEGKLVLMCRRCGYIHDKTKGKWTGCPVCGADDPEPKYWVEEKGEEVLDSNWSDIYGYSNTHGFPTENSEALLRRVIETTSREGDLVMDFFLGSGTTIAVAQKLHRKWIGVEMGEHFYTVVLPRMKRVLAYDESGISKDIRGYDERNAGGFFKYYDLEQYEQTLRRCRYLPSEPFAGIDLFQGYLFLKDPKLMDAVELDYSNNKAKVDLRKVYPNVDVAETLSLITGRRIKRIEKDAVVLEDRKMRLDEIDFKTIKPLIWW